MHAQSALQEKAHCAERRSIEGTSHIRRGRTETGRRLFSALPLSTVIAGQCFAPGFHLSPGKKTPENFCMCKSTV